MKDVGERLSNARCTTIAEGIKWAMKEELKANENARDALFGRLMELDDRMREDANHELAELRECNTIWEFEDCVEEEETEEDVEEEQHDEVDDHDDVEEPGTARRRLHVSLRRSVQNEKVTLDLTQAFAL